MNERLLAKELERDEGLRLKPYRDSEGHLTIGIGRNLECGITEGEALLMLQNDIKEVQHELDKEMPWWRGMDEVRQRVLANMCFNLGIEGLMRFHKALAAMEKGDYEHAAEEMADSKWDHEVGDRAVRLVAMMRTGNVVEG